MILFKNKKTEKISQEDLDFITDASQGELLRTPNAAKIILWIIFSMIVVVIIWANSFTINEIVRGQGKAIPISHIQVIQNISGGIVKSILVSEGQSVKKGDLLMELDTIDAEGSLAAIVAQTSSLLVEKIRLAAEVNDKKPDFTKEKEELHNKYVDTQLQLYSVRQQDLNKKIDDLHLKAKKARQSLVSAKQQQKDLTNQVRIISQQYKMNLPLLKIGAISKSAILDIEQSLSRAKTEANRVKNQLPELESEVERIDRQAEAERISFHNKAQSQLAEISTKLDIAKGKESVSVENVDRTKLRSPVTGVVQKLYINTVGGVAQSGMQLIDVIPIGDELLVEAKIKPKDIGFVQQGQKAKVKISAFDFAIYGGLEGIVETISADTITDRKGVSSYLVKIRVKKSYFTIGDERLNVIPGMQATVDISVAERSVLQYILKPLLRVLK